MGFFDKISEKAKEAAENAKKAAGEAIENASAEGSNIFGKVSDGFSSFTETVGTSAKELTTWAEGMPDKLRKMADDFDADAMWDKLSKNAAKAGQDLIVMVMTIYYSIESKITAIQNSKNNGKSK
ncbi:MAG: hypothetical protein K2N09_05730 [Muribaculaceae bacterium]|nr:hypothetical protein [Muribaculaceae bacterium]